MNDVEHVVVGYHYPCPDGAFAALAAWLFYNSSSLGQVHSGGKGVSSFSSSSSTKTIERKVTYLPLTVWSTGESRIEQFDEALKTAGAPKLMDSDGYYCSILYLLDFSGGQEFIRGVAQRAKRVLVIDHHKTAREDLEEMKTSDLGLPSNVTVGIDMAKSGASLSLDHFFSTDAALVRAITSVAPLYLNKIPSILGDQQTEARTVEELISQTKRNFALVEDNDLWRHELDGSKEFAAGFGSAKLELDPSKNPDVFEQLFCGIFTENVIEAGAAKLLNDKIIMDNEIKERMISLRIPLCDSEQSKSHLIYAVRTEHPELRSQLGHRIAEIAVEAPGYSNMGAVVYLEASMDPSMLKVSLRSIGDVDSTEISKCYGGGGHLNASSFVISSQVFETWLAGEIS